MQLHNDLSAMVLVYVGRLAANEQFTALLELGMSPTQMEELKALPLADINELSTIGTHFMSIRFDTESLDHALLILRQRRTDKTVIEALLKAGASFSMMKELTGMDCRCFKSWRNLLGISRSPGGRISNPSFDEEIAIWRCWKNFRREMDIKLHLLQIHETTQASLPLIWSLIKKWEKEKSDSEWSLDEETAYPHRAKWSGQIINQQN